MLETHSSLNQAEVAGALSGYFGVAAQHPGIVKLTELVLPDVQRAMERNPASWKTQLPGVIARYESAAREFGLTLSLEQQQRILLEKSNRTDSAYAAAQRGLDILGGRAAERDVSSTERGRALQTPAERAGLRSGELAGLENQFGKDGVATAMQQAEVLGLRGKQNIGLLAEFKDVGSALAGGNMDQAWALYNAEADPEKKKKILTLIQNAIEVKNKNNKELNSAIADKPKEEREAIKAAVEAYTSKPNDPKARKDYEALQQRYEGDKAVSKVLRETKDNNDALKKANAEQQKKNTSQKTEISKQDAKNVATTERSEKKVGEQEDIAAALNVAPAAAKTPARAVSTTPKPSQPSV